MSLLLFWQPVGDAPPVINIDYGLKPILSAVRSEKTSIEVERTKAVFQESTVTYNEPTVTYNDPNTYYGGADSVDGMGPRINNIDIQRPSFKKIGN